MTELPNTICVGYMIPKAAQNLSRYSTCSMVTLRPIIAEEWWWWNMVEYGSEVREWSER
jgi:hypothetical protein